MPTKRNRADQQQPYVPAGNGDASGEYADHNSGSNKHFTNFKKPDDNTVNVDTKTTTLTTEKKDNKQLLENIKQHKILQNLTPKQRYEILHFINNRKDYIENGKENLIISSLRFYNGSFGDLRNYSDEEIKDLISIVSQADFRENDDFAYIKKGGNWHKITSSQNTMYNLAGVKTYNEEEKILKENKTISDLVNKSQSSTDKEIQNIMGNGCVVCFGKGYSKDDTQQIVEATKILTDEFPQLRKFVNRMGDRNNLEKYINATKDQQTFTEEQITAKMEQIKSRYYFGAPSDEILRKSAINELKNKISFSNPGNAYAYWSPSSRSMIFRGIMKKTEEEQFNREFEMNFKSSGKKISVYYHEMGHAIDSMFEDILQQKKASFTDFKKSIAFNNMVADFYDKKRELIKQNFDSDYGKKALAEYNKNHNTNYQTMREFENRMTSFNRNHYEENLEMKSLLKKYNEKKWRLSEYGNTNNHEFVAESFAAYYTGMNNKLATDTVNLYKEYLKKMEEF